MTRAPWVLPRDESIRPGTIVQRQGTLKPAFRPGGTITAGVGTLAERLAQTGERWGLAAICIGVAQGLAVVVENVASNGGRS